jgi:hypothetical protein
VSNPNVDLLLHTNPFDGTELAEDAEVETFSMKPFKIIPNFNPSSSITLALVDPTNFVYPFVSSNFVFNENLHVFSRREAARPGVTHIAEYGGLGGPRRPLNKVLHPILTEVRGFISDYHFDEKEIIGFLENRVRELTKQEKLDLITSRGPISSSYNIQQMIIHQHMRHFYLDARQLLTESIKPESMIPGDRYADLLITNVLSDLQIARGAGLETHFMMPRSFMSDNRISASDCSFVGDRIIATNNPDVLKRYFEGVDLRNKFSNKEINIIMGYKGFFTKNDRFYILPNLMKAVELTHQEWERKISANANIVYTAPDFMIHSYVQKGSRRIALAARDTKNDQECILLFYEPTERQKKGKTYDEIVTDRKYKEILIQRYVDQEEENNKGILKFSYRPFVKVVNVREDGEKRNPDGSVENRVYLVLEKYDKTLSEVFPNGTKANLNDFFKYCLPWVYADSILANQGVVQLDIKGSNIGVKYLSDEKIQSLSKSKLKYSGEDEIQVLLGDSEEYKVVTSDGSSVITDPNTCSIDTRPPEIFKASEKKPVLVDLNIDVFSASCELFRVLTGWYPYSPHKEKPIEGGPLRDAYEREVKSNIDNKTRFDLLKELYEVPEELSDVVMKGIERFQTSRHKSAVNLFDDLEIVYNLNNIYNKIKEYVTKLEDKLSSNHLLRTENNLLLMYPNASLKSRIAALMHDGDKFFGEDVELVEGDYNQYKKNHAELSANLAKEYLLKIGATVDDANYISCLIFHHDDLSISERSKDDIKFRSDLQRIMDADSLTYFNYERNQYANDPNRATTPEKKDIFMQSKMSIGAAAMTFRP